MVHTNGNVSLHPEPEAEERKKSNVPPDLKLWSVSHLIAARTRAGTARLTASPSSRKHDPSSQSSHHPDRPLVERHRAPADCPTSPSRPPPRRAGGTSDVDAAAFPHAAHCRSRRRGVRPPAGVRCLELGTQWGRQSRDAWCPHRQRGPPDASPAGGAAVGNGGQGADGIQITIRGPGVDGISFTVHPLGSRRPFDLHPTARMHPIRTPTKRTERYPARSWRGVIPWRCLAGIRRAPDPCLHGQEFDPSQIGCAVFLLLSAGLQSLLVSVSMADRSDCTLECWPGAIDEAPRAGGGARYMEEGRMKTVRDALRRLDSPVARQPPPPPAFDY